MDWYVPNAHRDGSALRRELQAYFTRHARPGDDVAGAVLACSELLTNSIEHTDAHVWVNLEWGGSHPVVTIHDLGPAFVAERELPDQDSVTGRGIAIASELSIDIARTAKRDVGNRTTLVLDLERAEAPDLDPSPAAREASRLPRLDDADADGYFAREPFLTALAVQLVHTIESEHGPIAAEDAVATVGTTVGGQMEASYRDRRDLAGPLDATQLAELFVGLKHAIDGDFYVVEIADDKIVLGNRHCPFGDDVMFAPSLCRMTSSVFGGIAARNTGRDAAVHLEERIAVGDPECRVTVWLETPPDEIAKFVHRYRSRDA